MPVRSIALAVFVICSVSLRHRPRSHSRALRLRRSKPQGAGRIRIHRRQGWRSRVMFNEIAKVLTHPRCMNCHPAGEIRCRARTVTNICRRRGAKTSLQVRSAPPARLVTTTRTSQSPRPPPTKASPAIRAGASRRCRWLWQGKSIGDICRQVKDVSRNGGRDLALLQEHIAKDDLVAWGSNPGPGREPAPGAPGGRRQIGPGLDRYRRGVSLEPALDQSAITLPQSILARNPALCGRRPASYLRCRATGECR